MNLRPMLQEKQEYPKTVSQDVVEEKENNQEVSFGNIPKKERVA